MPTGPNIRVYELLESGVKIEFGRLLRPPEIFLTAKWLTRVEEHLLSYLEDAEARPFVSFYRDLFRDPVEEDVPLFEENFAWYCGVCTRVGVLGDMKDWQAAPEDFSPSVRYFIAYVLLCDEPLNDAAAILYYYLLDLCCFILEQEKEELAEAHQPEEVAEIEAAMGMLETLQELYKLAHNEKRTFLFGGLPGNLKHLIRLG